MQSEQQLPRRQRLVCHSNLPRTATDYAQNDQYAAIMEDLARKGVFFFKPAYADQQTLLTLIS
jgi:vacuolar protein sorting-associated protein 13A/C